MRDDTSPKSKQISLKAQLNYTLILLLFFLKTLIVKTKIRRKEVILTTI
jgi:hypothetical protein